MLNGLEKCMGSLDCEFYGVLFDVMQLDGFDGFDTQQIKNRKVFGFNFHSPTTYKKSLYGFSLVGSAKNAKTRS
jgi:hypothetical protein